MKMHKKMYKSGKNWMVASLTTVAMAGILATANTANADTVDTAKTDEQTTQQATQVANTVATSQQVNDAKQAVSDAQLNYDQASAAASETNDKAITASDTLNQATNLVNNVQSDVDQKSQEVAQLSDAAKNATPEDIQSAEHTVNADSAAIENQKDAINNAEQAVGNKQADINSAQKAVDEQQTAVKQAEIEKEAAKKLLNGDAVQTLVDQVEQDKQQIKDNDAKIAKDETALTDAQKTQSNVQSDVDNLTKQVSNAENNVKNKQSDVNRLNQDAIDAKADLVDAQASAKNFEPELKGLEASEFKLPEDYITAIQEAQKSNKSSDYYSYRDANAKKQMEKAGDAIWDDVMNNFPQQKLVKDSDKRIAMIIGEKPISKEDQFELSQYATAIINSFNAQIGNKDKFYNSMEANNIANEIADQAISEGNDNDHGKAVNRRAIFDKYEINGTEALKPVVKSLYPKGTKMTMGQLKNNIRLAILYMILGDAESDWGHTASIDITSIAHDAQYSQVPGNYFIGLTIQENGAIRINPMTPMKETSQLWAADHGDKPTLTDMIDQVKKDNQETLNKINDAQNNLNAKQGQLNEAKSALDNAKVNLTNVTNQLNKSQEQLTSAKQAAINVQNQLNADRSDSSKLSAKLNEDKQKLDNYKQNHETALEDYNKASQALDNAQAELNNREKVLDNAKNQMQDTQKSLDDANAKMGNLKKQLADDTKKLDNLKNAQGYLIEAQKELTDLQSKLEKAKAAKADAQEAYDQIKKINDDAQAKKDEAKSKLDEAQTKLDKILAQIKKQEQQKAKDDGYHIDDKGQVVDKGNQPVSDMKVKDGAIVDEHGQEIVPAPEKKIDNSTSNNDEQSDVNKEVTVDGTKGHYAYDPVTGTMTFVANTSNNAQNGKAIQATSYPTRAEVKRNAQKGATSNELPQTGDDNALAMMGLGGASLVAMFGLSGVTKRRHSA